MACLTRQLYKHLQSYLSAHPEMVECGNHSELKNRLVKRGLCPSTVTGDQIGELVRQIRR